MNSIKSTITILFLLGVSYGVYRLIHTPDAPASGTSSFFVGAGTSTSGGSASNPTMDLPMRAGSNSTVGMPTAGQRTAAPPPLPKIAAPTLTPSPPQLGPTDSNSIAAAATEMNSLPSTLTKQNPSANLIPTTPESTMSQPVSGMAPISADPRGSTAPVATTAGSLTPVQRSDTATTQPEIGGGALPSLRPSTNAAQPSSSPGETISTELAKPTPPSAQIAAEPKDLKSVWPIVDAQIRKGEITQSLQVLSGYYHANLSDVDRAELLRWLDALAFKVIYSTEHRLSPTPHVVREGESLDSIAKDWNVPKDLIANINRGKIPESNILTPGLELKVVRGPFRAEIDARRRELTLFLDRCYAGRFAIDTSKCATLQAGQFAVQKLEIDPAGKYRLELSGGCCLVAGSPIADPNAIQMSVADARDVFGILSADSQLTVLR